MRPAMTSAPEGGRGGNTRRGYCGDGGGPEVNAQSSGKFASFHQHHMTMWRRNANTDHGGG